MLACPPLIQPVQIVRESCGAVVIQFNLYIQMDFTEEQSHSFIKYFRNLKSYLKQNLSPLEFYRLYSEEFNNLSAQMQIQLIERGLPRIASSFSPFISLSIDIIQHAFSIHSNNINSIQIINKSQIPTLQKNTVQAKKSISKQNLATDELLFFFKQVLKQTQNQCMTEYYQKKNKITELQRFLKKRAFQNLKPSGVNQVLESLVKQMKKPCQFLNSQERLKTCPQSTFYQQVQRQQTKSIERLKEVFRKSIMLKSVNVPEKMQCSGHGKGIIKKAVKRQVNSVQRLQRKLQKSSKDQSRSEKINNLQKKIKNLTKAYKYLLSQIQQLLSDRKNSSFQWQISNRIAQNLDLLELNIKKKFKEKSFKLKQSKSFIYQQKRGLAIHNQSQRSSINLQDTSILKNYQDLNVSKDFNNKELNLKRKSTDQLLYKKEENMMAWSSQFNQAKEKQQLNFLEVPKSKNNLSFSSPQQNYRITLEEPESNLKISYSPFENLATLSTQIREEPLSYQCKKAWISKQSRGQLQKKKINLSRGTLKQKAEKLQKRFEKSYKQLQIKKLKQKLEQKETQIQQLKSQVDKLSQKNRTLQIYKTNLQQFNASLKQLNHQSSLQTLQLQKQVAFIRQQISSQQVKTVQYASNLQKTKMHLQIYKQEYQERQNAQSQIQKSIDKIQEPFNQNQSYNLQKQSIEQIEQYKQEEINKEVRSDRRVSIVLPANRSSEQMSPVLTSFYSINSQDNVNSIKPSPTKFQSDQEQLQRIFMSFPIFKFQKNPVQTILRNQAKFKVLVSKVDKSSTQFLTDLKHYIKIHISRCMSNNKKRLCSHLLAFFKRIKEIERGKQRQLLKTGKWLVSEIEVDQ